MGKKNVTPAAEDAVADERAARKKSATEYAAKLSADAHKRYGAATLREKAAWNRVMEGADVLDRIAHAEALDEVRDAKAALAEAYMAIKDAAALPAE